MEDFVAEIDPLVMLIVVAFLPPIQAVINSTKWSSSLKALVAILVTIPVAGIVGYFMGIDTREGYLATWASVYVGSQIAYFGVFKPTGLAAKIEENTLPRG